MVDSLKKVPVMVGWAGKTQLRLGFFYVEFSPKASSGKLT